MSDAMAGVLRALLGPAVGIGVTDPRDETDDLWPQERSAILRALPKRQHEFAAGRRAARLAMAQLGLQATAIPQGPQRAPVWPVGLTGSIAHCDTACIAAVSRTHRSMGIDVEPDTPLDADLIPIICGPREQDWLDSLRAPLRGISAKRIFCAKEAAYKAQFPLTGQVIGFTALEITLARDDTFAGTWQPPLANMPALRGRIGVHDGLIVASVLI